MGFYDAAAVNRQYFRENMDAATGEFKANKAVTLTAKWTTGKGIFAGRFSQYQVFDCWRSPAYPNANEIFRAHTFGLPFNDTRGDERRLTA